MGKLGSASIALALLFCTSGSGATSADRAVSAVCIDHPTSDCLVDAFYVSPLPGGYVLADGAIVFSRLGRLDLAVRLATSAEDFAGPDELFEQELAEAWHASGKEEKAQTHLMEALTLLAKRQHVVLPIHDAYLDIAQTEVRWGHPEKVEGILARMKTDAGVDFIPMWRAYAEARMWLLAGRTDRALASIMTAPQDNRFELLRRMKGDLRCDGATEAQCVNVAESIKFTPDAMSSFAVIASDAVETPGSPEKMLAEASKFLQASPDFAWHGYEAHFGDSLAELSRAWLELGQPDKALEILDLRSSDTRLAAPSGLVPIEELDLRAMAFASLGRKDLALAVADSAAQEFAMLPEKSPLRAHILWESIHGRWRSPVGHDIDIRRQIEADMAKAAVSRPVPLSKTPNNYPVPESETRPRLRGLRQEAREGHGSEALRQVIASEQGIPLQEAILVIAEGLAEAR